MRNVRSTNDNHETEKGNNTMATDQGGTPAAPAKGTNWLLWIGCGAFIFLVVLPVGGFFLCCGGLAYFGASQAKERENKVETEPGIAVTTKEISKAYAENSGTADTKYKDQVVILSGTISSVDSDTVHLDPDYLDMTGKLNSIMCRFQDKNKGQLTGLKKGDTVKVKGYCTGTLIGILDIQYCKVEK